MKVAALYDVHGMPWALEAVLADLEREQVDAVVFGGDLVSGPFPAETLELARDVDAVFLRGNADREPDAWVRRALTPADLDWLRSLAMTTRLDAVEYCHSTPEDDMPLLTAETPLNELAAAVAGAQEETLVIGHTHHQFDRRAGAVRVVNAGSVGMPYENEVAAFWAVVDEGEPSFRRTAIDVERAVAQIRASAWPEADEFIVENLLVPPSRDEAIAHFERRRA